MKNPRDDNSPTFCKECRSLNTFERNPDKDIKTESGLAFMLSWKCRACGHTSLTSNHNYRNNREEVMAANKKD